jgi:regulator of protease activity HflC (stomatin/prohibitin superfamily)
MATGTYSPTNINQDWRLYMILQGVGVIFLITLLILAVVYRNTRFFDFGLTFDGGPTFTFLTLAYVALSFYEVPAGELGGAYFYGQALRRLRSGPTYAPFGLMQVKKAPHTVQEFQCPGEPETVFKGDDREPLPPGMVRPIRAVTRAPNGNENKILDAQMTLDLNFVVQYVIDDILDFVANFGTQAQIERQLRDVGEATLAERVTKETPRSFIEALPDVNTSLITATQGRFEHSGVKILSIRLISPDVSHGVSSALANIPVARAEAEQAAARAEGEKTKRIKEGEGAASAAKSMLEAQASGRKAMMETLKVDGKTVLASEAALSLSQKTVVVVGAEGGMRDMMGLVKGAQAALNTNGGNS